MGTPFVKDAPITERLSVSKKLEFRFEIAATNGRPYTKYRNIANCRGEHCSPLNKICLFIQTEAL